MGSTPEERAQSRADNKAKKAQRIAGVGRAVLHTDDASNPSPQLQEFIRTTGRLPHLPVASHVADLLNPENGWGEWLTRFLARPHRDNESNEEYRRSKLKLFKLACEFGKSEAKKRDEGLRNASGDWTARGRYWRESIKSGHIPTREQLDMIGSQAATRNRQPSAPSTQARGRNPTTRQQQQPHQSSSSAGGASAAPQRRRRSQSRSRQNRDSSARPSSGQQQQQQQRLPSLATAPGDQTGASRRPRPASATATSGQLQREEELERQQQQQQQLRRQQQQRRDLSAIQDARSQLSGPPGLARRTPDPEPSTSQASGKKSKSSLQSRISFTSPDRSSNNRPSNNVVTENSRSELASGLEVSQNPAFKPKNRVTFGSDTIRTMNADSPPYSVGLNQPMGATGAVPKRPIQDRLWAAAQQQQQPRPVPRPVPPPAPAPPNVPSMPGTSGAAAEGAAGRAAPPLVRQDSSPLYFPPSPDYDNLSESVQEPDPLPGQGGQGQGHQPQPQLQLQPQPQPPQLPQHQAEQGFQGLGPIPPAAQDSQTDDEDEGGHRVIAYMSNGAALTPNQAREMWDIIDEALEQQQRNQAELPILVNDWQPRRGRLSIIPGGVGPDNQSNGDQLISLINDRLNLATMVNGAHLHARWNFQLPRVARLTIRAGSRGDPQELIESETLGIARLNRWPAHLRGGVRFTGTIPSEDPNYRLIRFEASPEVVAQIQAQGGSIHIGRLLGTVQSGKKAVKRGANINFVLQK